MTGHYEYTPCIWPMVASPALLLVPGAYAWRHRSAPGARPFTAALLAVPPAVVLVLMTTSSRHDVLCSAFSTQGDVRWLVNLLTHGAVVFSSQSERVMTTDGLLRVIESRTGTATKKT